MAMARQALRQRREQLDLSQEQIALALGVSTTTYRAWESGTSLPRVGRRRRLAQALQWTAAQLNVALDGNGATTNGQAVPSWLTLHAALEQTASRIWTFQPFTVHALLQSRDYATAVERADAVPRTEEGVTRRVEIRMARQAVLDREPDPLALAVILDESVLRRVTGGPAVMADQLDHLADMACRPNLDLRVLPLDAGRHSAAFGGFTVIATQGVTDPQVVCVEDRTGIRYLEGSHAVEAHVSVFDHLIGHALPPEASVDLITAAAKEYQP